MELKASIQIDASEVLKASENVNRLVAELAKFKVANQESVEAIAEFIKANQISEKTIQETIRALVQQSQTLPIASESYQQAVTSVTNLKNALELLTRSTNTLGTEFTNARLVVSQFLYILQDSAYIFTDFRMGMMAISNNIPFLVQGFANLREQAGSTREALKTFVGVMRGPIGIVAVVSLLVTLLQALSLQFRRSGKEVKEASDLIKQSWDEAAKSAENFRAKILVLEEDLRSFRVDMRKAIEIDVDIRKGIEERLRIVRAEIKRVEQAIESLSRHRFAVPDENLSKRLKELREEEQKLLELLQTGSVAYRNYERTIYLLIEAAKKYKDDALIDFLKKHKITEAQIRATIRTLEEFRRELAIGSDAYKENLQATARLNEALKILNEQAKDTKKALTLQDIVSDISKQIKAVESLAISGELAYTEAIKRLEEFRLKLEELKKRKDVDIVLRAEIQTELERIENFPENLLKEIKKRFAERVESIVLRYKLEMIGKDEAIKEIEAVREEFKNFVKGIPKELLLEKDIKLIDAEIFEKNIKEIEEAAVSAFAKLKREFEQRVEDVVLKLRLGVIGKEEALQEIEKIREEFRERVKDVKVEVKSEVKSELDVIELEVFEKKIKEVERIAESFVKEFKRDIEQRVEDVVLKLRLGVIGKEEALQEIEKIREEVKSKAGEIPQQDVELMLKLIDRQVFESEIKSATNILERGFDAAFDYISSEWRRTWGKNMNLFKAVIAAMADELMRQLGKALAQLVIGGGQGKGGEKGFNLWNLLELAVIAIGSIFLKRQEIPVVPAGLGQQAVPAVINISTNYVTRDELRALAYHISDSINNRLLDLRIENRLNIEHDWIRFDQEITNYMRNRTFKKITI